MECVAEETLVLQAGRVVEYGPTQTVFSKPQQAYTQALMAAGRWTGGALFGSVTKLDLATVG